MTYRKILNMGLDQIQSMKYNDLRVTLSELNREANRRLEVWKRNTRKTIEPPTEIKSMLSSGGWFKQSQKVTKAELLKQIQERQRLLSMKTSTVWGAREVRKNLLNRFRGFLEEQGLDSSNITIDAYNRFEKLKKRLKDSGMLAQLSQDEYAEAVKYVSKITKSQKIDNIDELYTQASDYINKQLIEYQQKKARISNELMGRMFKP